MRLTAIVIFLALALGGSALAAPCRLAETTNDQWRLTHEGGNAWLVTPCGERFFSIGVNVVDGGAPDRVVGDQVRYSWTAFAPSLDDWIAETRGRLASWGFNSAGGWSLPGDRLQLPSIPELELGSLARFHWADPFSPATEQAMMDEAERLIAPYRSSPWRIGYFSDNERGWWGGALFVIYGTRPAENWTKQRWLTYVRQSYSDDFVAFMADFVPPPGVTDWDGLRRTTEPTRLRPGGRGIGVVREWTEIVAERYYDLAERAIRTADPHALFFGDRLPIYYDPMAIKAEARHVDAIATNYNVDAPDGWVARYYFDALHTLTKGKPVLVSEWFFAAMENRTGNLNSGHLMTVPTQEARAEGAAEATRQFARIPDLIGLHWFQYTDDPKGGRKDGEDYDFGLVDIDDHPYLGLTNALAANNAALPDVHAMAGRDDTRQTQRSDIEIPYAEIGPAEHSLARWPKPAALLPPLIASPGEVPFGEAYLAWNTDGLALGTVGQDYYDLTLLAYDGSYPLSEAYRVELGVDAGAGPRAFTLYFIPPKTKAKDHPPMQALLCAGAAGSECVAVPEAKPQYFGADQPRIASATLLPWSVLGLDGPPKNGQMRIEVASTAWYRSRWMSLTGLAPERGMKEPSKWITARLGRTS
jgi:hypothetical protein